MRCFGLFLAYVSVFKIISSKLAESIAEDVILPSLLTTTSTSNNQLVKELQYPILHRQLSPPDNAAAESGDPQQLQLLSNTDQGQDQQIPNSKQNRRKKNKALRKKKKKHGNQSKRSNPEYHALKIWADSLTEADYNETHWRTFYHSRSSVDFFNGYARRISDIFKKVDAKVNFAMVGACDGTGDNTIKYLYLPNSHWRGVFVEPMGINVRDLIHYMSVKNAAHRSLIIRAAATSVCANATLQVERPLYEEKNDSSIPHWLRRQIGSVLPTTRKHARKEWIIEEVRCVTAKDILSDWASGFNGRGGSGASFEQESTGGEGSEEMREVKTMKADKRRIKFRRPHILKIDVEGHDFEVLMGFLSHDTPPSQLPLIVDFEAKSIAKKYPLAKERMEYLGYAVTPFGQDGFALLRADKVREGLVDQEDYFPSDLEPDI